MTYTLGAMHKEILSPEQFDLLSLVGEFKGEFYLVGGTAIALIIGHRRSIDFDLFKQKGFRSKKIIDKLVASNFDYKVTRNVKEQLNLIINGVKFTFFEYTFPIKPTQKFEEYIKMPTLLDLAAMKAYALGRRSKWKDYVDLYFIIKNHFTIDQIGLRAEEIYQQLFSQKLFRAQLAYHKDIDYSEEVDYLVEPIDEKVIRDYLIEVATDIL